MPTPGRRYLLKSGAVVLYCGEDRSGNETCEYISKPGESRVPVKEQDVTFAQGWLDKYGQEVPTKWRAVA